MDEANREFAEAFYRRQVILKELGVAGQEKLAKSKVAVVGVGGLGSVASLYLALAGIGYIRIVDQDTVETHNLHRQILYTPNDLHHLKAEIAAKTLQKHNPLVEIEAVSERLNESNAVSLLKGMDCVVDGLDNKLTRYAVNRACMKLRVPYVFGAAIGLEGNLSVFEPPETGCLECFMPQHVGSDQPCSSLGIIGATPAIIGGMQAMETLKLLTGMGQPLKGKMLVADFRDMDFTTVPVTKNPRCPVCGDIHG
jgi:sulfur carrier protein ThiS adenylyltransferase